MNDITFQRNLMSVMFDNKYDRYVKNRKTGKLNTTSLYKVNTSNKLFKRKEARLHKNYSISIVVDCSGSMEGHKIAMAAECAKKISHHLGVVGINHNIVVFNAGASEIKPFSIKEDKRVDLKIKEELYPGIYYFWIGKEDAMVKARNGNPIYPFYGSAREDDAIKMQKEIEKKYGTSKNVRGPAWNSDAEALKFSRELLLKQKGDKLMIFLSDGSPAPGYNSFESPINPGFVQNDFKVKEEVKKTLSSGIELYSIGILDDSVNKYYPEKRTCTINDIKQLYPHIIKLIRLNIKRG